MTATDSQRLCQNSPPPAEQQQSQQQAPPAPPQHHTVKYIRLTGGGLRRPPKPEVVGCHWFRRNLRVSDNPSLLHAFAPPVTSVFTFYILGDEFPDGDLLLLDALGRRSPLLSTVGTDNLPHTSACRRRFLLECLEDIDRSLKMIGGQVWIFQRGTDPQRLIQALKRTFDIRLFTFEPETHADSIGHDESLMAACRRIGVDVRQVSGQNLWEPTKLWTALDNRQIPTTIEHFAELAAEIGHPYIPVWPLKDLLDAMAGDDLRPGFFDLAARVQQRLGPSTGTVADPSMEGGSLEDIQFLADNLITASMHTLIQGNRRADMMSRRPCLKFVGGETFGRQILSKQKERWSKDPAADSMDNEELSRELQQLASSLYLNPTMTISPYIANGCISVRTFYQAVFGNNLPKAGKLADTWLEKVPKLLWREYMYFLASKKVYYRNLLSLRHSKFPVWAEGELELLRWKQGQTGFPFIDATMRQLLREGWVPACGRIAAAMFLTNVLWMDPGKGVVHFVKYSLDADSNICQGNFSWIASPRFCVNWLGGCLTCFARFILGVEFDQLGVFMIRKFLPEFRNLPDGLIYAPWKAGSSKLVTYGVRLGQDYPERMVSLEDRVMENRRKIRKFMECLSDEDKAILWGPASSCSEGFLPCTLLANFGQQRKKSDHKDCSSTYDPNSANIRTIQELNEPAEPPTSVQ